MNQFPDIKEIENLAHICKILAQSPFYQKLGPGGVLAIWLTAREMGLPPMMCLNGGLYTFSGAVSLSAELMHMMIVKDGHRVDVLELNNKGCRLKFYRRDRPKGQGDTFEYTYTMEQATKAGYANKNNWKENPEDMLFSRCLSKGARKFMPDVTKKAYVHGEIQGEDDENSANLPEVTFSNQPNQPVKEEEPKEIDYQKALGMAEFRAKYGLEEPNSKHMQFIRVSAHKCNMSVDKCLYSAMQKEDVFLDKFKAWNKNAPNEVETTSNEA